MSIQQQQYSLTKNSFKSSCGEKYSFAKHFHSNYEFLRCIKGVCVVTVNGKEEVLEKDDILIIPPYALHSTNLENGGIWLATFSRDFITSFDENHRSIQYSKFRLSREVEAFIKPKLFENAEISKLMRISCLYLICNECLANATIVDRLDYKFVSSIIDYITEHLEWEITLRGISEALGYEYHYFSSLFHQHFDMNFKEFINRMRFEAACSLLSQDKSDISLISNKCGFGSIRNFNRVFKQFAECSPKEYRFRTAETNNN